MRQYIIQITGCLLFSILLGRFPEIISDIEGNNCKQSDVIGQKGLKS